MDENMKPDPYTPDGYQGSASDNQYPQYPQAQPYQQGYYQSPSYPQYPSYQQDYQSGANQGYQGYQQYGGYQQDASQYPQYQQPDYSQYSQPDASQYASAQPDVSQYSSAEPVNGANTAESEPAPYSSAAPADSADSGLNMSDADDAEDEVDDSNYASEKSAKKREKASTESAAEEEANRKRKTMTITTFFFSFLFLIGGLFIPLFCNFEGASLTQKMMISYVPAMFNSAVKQSLIPIGEGGFFSSALPWAVSSGIDFASIFCLLYALTAVLSLFMLIAVCAANRTKPTGIRCAFAVEIMGILFISAYIVTNMAESVFIASNSNGQATVTWNDFASFIVLGGLVIMAAAQSIYTKGIIGISKTFGIILSVLALIAMLDLALLIPKLKTPLDNFSPKMGGDTTANFMTLADNFKAGAGICGLFWLINFGNFAGKILSSGYTAGVSSAIILTIVVALMSLINLICDSIGIATGKKFDKFGEPCKNIGSNAFALTRYLLTFLTGVALIILGFVVEGLKPGLYLFIFEIIMLLALLNAAIRTAADNARCRQMEREKAGSLSLDDKSLEEEEKPEEEEEPEQYTEVVPLPTPAPAPAPAPAAQPANNGPTIIMYNNAAQQPAPAPAPAPAYPSTYPVYTPFPTAAGATEEDSEPEITYEEDYSALEDGFDAEDEMPVDEEPVEEVAPPAEEAKPEEEEKPEEHEYPYGYDSTPYIDVPQDEQPKEEAKEDKPEEDNEEPQAVYFYAGESDEFMDTLTDSEKVEFFEVFIKKSRGSVSGVPDYKMNEKNEDFYPAVFVHINRYRSLISDGLLGKMYKQLGKLD